MFIGVTNFEFYLFFSKRKTFGKKNISRFYSRAKSNVLTL